MIEFFPLHAVIGLSEIEKKGKERILFVKNDGDVVGRGIWERNWIDLFIFVWVSEFPKYIFLFTLSYRHGTAH